MTTYVVEDDNGVTVAVNEDKAEACRIAREQCPNDVLLGTAYDEDGQEIGGFFVSATPF